MLCRRPCPALMRDGDNVVLCTAALVNDVRLLPRLPAFDRACTLFMHTILSFVARQEDDAQTVPTFWARQSAWRCYLP